ncbi:uncharacterized protein UDID_08819 [Ustilago sp. UG-2017a]|nr:uncharacterized protein UDID_08819 [Ustilago sp. UG-2017a]
MKPSFTILLLTLFATLAVAAPVSYAAGREVVEDASESISNRFSNLALHHPTPSSSQGGRPTLTIPIRPESVVVHGPIPEPSISRASDLIRSWKKGAARDKTPSRLKTVLKKVIQKNRMEKQRPKLERQHSMNQKQWTERMEHVSGSGKTAISSPVDAGSSMDFSRINDQDDTASSRTRP